MRFFEPNDHVAIAHRQLPHWAQAGTVCFVTWRTHDSMPKAVLAEWLEARDRWLLQHELAPSSVDWKEQLARCDPALLAEFHAKFTMQWEDALDACHGACELRRPEVARVVSESLLHFDGSMYEMIAFVVMPNHVHLLATFADEQAMLAQCESWKRFTATQINRLLGQSGRFWQQDAFDHLVRHEKQFVRLCRYIAENPSKAHLKDGEFVLYSGRHAPRDGNEKGPSCGA
jgi:type I restriction enzyme R subunit